MRSKYLRLLVLCYGLQRGISAQSAGLDSNFPPATPRSTTRALAAPANTDAPIFDLGKDKALVTDDDKDLDGGLGSESTEVFPQSDEEVSDGKIQVPRSRPWVSLYDNPRLAREYVTTPGFDKWYFRYTGERYAGGVSISNASDQGTSTERQTPVGQADLSTRTVPLIYTRGPQAGSTVDAKKLSVFHLISPDYLERLTQLMETAARKAPPKDVKRGKALFVQDVVSFREKYFLQALNKTAPEEGGMIRIDPPPQDFLNLLNGAANGDGALNDLGLLREGFLVNTTLIRCSPYKHQASDLMLRDFQRANINKLTALALAAYLVATQDAHLAFIEELRKYLNDNHALITGRRPRGRLLGETFHELARGDYLIATQQLHKVRDSRALQGTVKAKQDFYAYVGTKRFEDFVPVVQA